MGELSKWYIICLFNNLKENKQKCDSQIAPFKHKAQTNVGLEAKEYLFGKICVCLFALLLYYDGYNWLYNIGRL